MKITFSIDMKITFSIDTNHNIPLIQKKLMTISILIIDFSTKKIKIFNFQWLDDD